MQFKSVGVIINPSVGGFFSDYYESEFCRQLEELQSKSDFVIVTVDGKEIFTAYANYAAGMNCEFSAYDEENVQKAEGFKRI